MPAPDQVQAPSLEPAGRTRGRSLERNRRIAAGFALVLLAGVWTWWALEQGAYFGVVLYPSGVLLCAGVIVLARFAPLGGARLSPLAIAALGGLVALAGWSLLSAIWSPTPDTAVADAQRIFLYAVCFVLGMWLRNLLGERSHLALAPAAIAGAAAGIVTVIALLNASHPVDLVTPDGTLDYPLGYRNANAAFFAIAIWPCLGLAQSSGLDWRLRGLSLGAAGLCLDLSLLSQSRGSIIAGAVGFTVYLLLIPSRLRGLIWLALVALPALIVVPSLIDLYHAVNETGRLQAADELQAAARAAAIGAVITAVAGLLLARLEVALPGPVADLARANRAVLALAGLALVGALLAFAVAVGDPVDWLGQRVKEFPKGTPNLSQGSTRFSFNAGSSRIDAWRVAVRDVKDNPVLGDGAGGYRLSYDRRRDSPNQNLHDAHSVELEVLSELGVPGFLLWATAIVGAFGAALSARRFGPGSAAVSAVVLTAAAYWLTHTSIDWFWPYPVVTGPVLGMLGAAAGRPLPAAQPQDAAASHGGRGWRLGATVAAALLAVSLVPPFLSARYVDDAYQSWRSSPQRAADDLDRARSLNPLSIEPLLAEGAIAQASGQRSKAISAFADAARRRPEEWSTHYFLGQLYSRRQPGRALEEARRANQLNPLSPRVNQLLKTLDEQQSASADASAGAG